MAKNPNFFERGKVVGDLVAQSSRVVQAVVTDANEDNLLALGTPVLLEAAENSGYTATKAQEEANGILLEGTDANTKEVAILINGELKESFYAEPLSKTLRTSLLKAGITLR